MIHLLVAIFRGIIRNLREVSKSSNPPSFFGGESAEAGERQGMSFSSRMAETLQTQIAAYQVSDLFEVVHQTGATMVPTRVRIFRVRESGGVRILTSLVLEVEFFPVMAITAFIGNTESEVTNICNFRQDFYVMVREMASWAITENLFQDCTRVS